MSQNGSGSGAVTGDVVGFGGGFFEQLSAHILKWVFQLNFLGHGDTVMGNSGGAPLFVQSHVAPLRPQGGGYGLGQGIDAGF